MVRVKGTKGRWGKCSKGVSYKKEGRMDEEGKRKDRRRTGNVVNRIKASIPRCADCVALITFLYRA